MTASVEVRCLAGESTVLDNCDTIASVMTRSAILHDRFASEVAVISESGEQLTDLAALPPATVSIVFLPETPGFDDDSVRRNLLLHAAHQDVPRCVRMLEMVTNRDDITLDWVIDGSEYENCEKTIISLLHAGVPLGKSLPHIASAGFLDAVQVALAAGADVEAKDDEDATALLAAARSGHRGMVQRLLDSGASLEATQYGVTALLVAAVSGHSDVAKVLIAANGCVNDADDYGHTPLVVAAVNAPIELVELLLAEGADVNHADSSGGTALVNAAHSGRCDVVQQLVSGGAIVNHADNLGHTALMAAASGGHRDIVELLLAEGASSNQVDANKGTPRDHAENAGHQEVVDLLQQG